MESMPPVPPAGSDAAAEAARLVLATARADPGRAVQALLGLPDQEAGAVLERLNPAVAYELLVRVEDDRRHRLLAAAPAEARRQIERNQACPAGSVGRLMRPAHGVFPGGTTAAEAVAWVRRAAGELAVTYLYTTDPAGRLDGVVVLRDLFLAEPETPLGGVAIRPVFSLRPDLPLAEAMRAAAGLQLPVYPVVDDDGRVAGLVRGQALFENQAFQLTLQGGAMVGVGATERLHSPVREAVAGRAPWLQFNLLLGLATAGVVTAFRDDISRNIMLAVLLPVIAQHGRNSGAQSMAVVLRAINLGDYDEVGRSRVLARECLIGVVNGLLTGLPAALVTWAFCRLLAETEAVRLAVAVFFAMVFGGLAGAVVATIIPPALRALGRDPARSSSILLSNASTVVSQALFLGLAAWLI